MGGQALYGKGPQPLGLVSRGAGGKSTV